MTYLAYLDEFGHIGPYVSKEAPKYNESPVFGFAGFVLPAEEVRGFGTWFFQQKCHLLNADIQRSGEHPAFWEKKGSSLYTVRNVLKYQELRHFTYRLFNKIENLRGFVFYVGVKKTATLTAHRPNMLYAKVFLEAIKRIDQFCALDCQPPSHFLLILDEHQLREDLITRAAQSMYGKDNRRHLIEMPFHLESHRYQTLQAADWIAGLIGRLGALWADSVAYAENDIFRKYFVRQLKRICLRSGIRS